MYEFLSPKNDESVRSHPGCNRGVGTSHKEFPFNLCDWICQDLRCYCCRSAAQHNANTRSPDDSFPVWAMFLGSNTWGTSKHDKKTVKLELARGFWDCCKIYIIWTFANHTESHIEWNIPAGMPNILQETTIYIVNILTRSPSPLWHHPTTLSGTPWRTILSDHRPCKLKVLPRKSSRFHNPQSNVLQFLPYSSPASALDASYGRMALCFHENGRKPKWKFWGAGDVWFVYLFLPLKYLFMRPSAGGFQKKYLPSQFQDDLCWSATWKGILNQWVIHFLELFAPQACENSDPISIICVGTCDKRQVIFRFFALHWLRETDSLPLKIGRDP